MPRHAHEDALSEAEFEQLVDGAKLLEPPLNSAERISKTALCGCLIHDPNQ